MFLVPNNAVCLLKKKMSIKIKKIIGLFVKSGWIYGRFSNFWLIFQVSRGSERLGRRAIGPELS